jgi:hypothetical protein
MLNKALIDKIFFDNSLEKVINIGSYSVQKSSKSHPACVFVFFTSFFHSCAYLSIGNLALTGYFRFRLYPDFIMLKTK